MLLSGVHGATQQQLLGGVGGHVRPAATCAIASVGGQRSGGGDVVVCGVDRSRIGYRLRLVDAPPAQVRPELALSVTWEKHPACHSREERPYPLT